MGSPAKDFDQGRRAKSTGASTARDMSWHTILLKSSADRNFLGYFPGHKEIFLLSRRKPQSSVTLFHPSEGHSHVKPDQ